jgi:hypothetical protein
MAMENSGAVSSVESLLMATLAGAFYNVYEYMGPDDFGLYYPTRPALGDFTPIARGSYVNNVVRTNKLLKALGQDLASKWPSGASGTTLAYFNLFSNSTLETGNILDFPVTFSPVSTSGVGIGIVRSDHLLASTRIATFTIGDITTYGISAVEYGVYNWAKSWPTTPIPTPSARITSPSMLPKVFSSMSNFPTRSHCNRSTGSVTSAYM